MIIERTTIRTNEAGNKFVQLYKQFPPDYAAFDTETTGLHIIYDRPFLFQFGWVNMEHERMFTFVVDLEKQPILGTAVIRQWHRMVRTCKVYAAHNVKYDLHMLMNIHEPYEESNITDGMIYIRAAMDNIPTRAGGTPLQLKQYCTKYIDKQAKDHDKRIQSERTAIAKALNRDLQLRFKEIGAPEGQKSWTKKYMDDMFKDVCFNMNTMDVEYQVAYMDWLKEVPADIKRNMRLYTVQSEDVPYNLVNRTFLIEYGHEDIVLLLKLIIKLDPIIRTRQTMNTVEFENRCIYPLLRMERVGFKVNKPYLDASVTKVMNYIKDRRSELYGLAGCKIKIGQHAAIKQILHEQYGLHVAGTGDDILSAELNRLGDEHPAANFIHIIQELRTLEKWIAVYMQRFQIDLRKGDSDRIYTQINQVGTASGRVTSDFQQFPKKGLKDANGEELFHPRRMVLAEGNGLVYLDYSQIELRLQALYTILCGTPDLNLCRAYMPYRCYRYTHPELPELIEREEFDYNNQAHIAEWNKGDWCLNEAGDTAWEPTDLHGATTTEAFHVGPDDPDWGTYRGYGKRMNFMKNYGGGIVQTRALLQGQGYTEEEIQYIDGAYYRAFPGVKEYQNYCHAVANRQAYAENLLGIKYYNVSGHNLINMMIQGSGAYFLKEKIVAVDEYLKDKHSRFQMNIHDELSFIWDPRDPFEIFYDIRKIMEEWEGCLVPIVADMELTTTNWAEKEEIK